MNGGVCKCITPDTSVTETTLIIYIVMKMIWIPNTHLLHLITSKWSWKIHKKLYYISPTHYKTGSLQLCVGSIFLQMSDNHNQ